MATGTKSLPLLAMLLLVVCMGAGGDQAAAAADGAAAAQVRLRPHCPVDGDDISLETLADIAGGHSQQRRDMARVVIAAAPLPGHTRIIDADYVAVRLRQSGFAAGTWRLGGADRTAVTRSHQSVTPRQLREIAAAHVRSHLPYPAKDVFIRDVKTGSAVILPKGELSYRIQGPPTRDYLGAVPLVIDFSVDRKPVKQIVVTVRSEVQGMVLVTQRPLARFEALGEDDVALVSMDLARLPGNRLSDPDQVIGKRARRTIPAQTVLTDGLVETPPLVHRGDRVQIVAELGALRVTALGEVRSRGRLGERVPVRNLDSHRKVHARVVDEKTVVVEF